MRNAFIFLSIFLSTLVYAQPKSTTVVFHEVDTQLTFWEARGKNKAGPLMVPGSAAITHRIARIKKAVLNSTRLKAIASMDWHLPYEISHPELFPEFKTFKSHARVGLTGPEGPSRLPEVEIFPPHRQIIIPHHEMINDQFAEVPYDLKANQKAIADPRNEVVIHKNGLDSYNVFTNPFTEQIYQMVNPTAVFVYGVATDFCVYWAVMELLKRNYKVYVIKDAIAGIFPEGTATKTREMINKGATFVTTQEALALAFTLTHPQKAVSHE